MTKIGILAFGSIITDPGSEIEEATDRKFSEIETDFKIEFSRTSEKRAGAPTLAVHEAGSTVLATLFVLNDGISCNEAKNILFRRETNKVGNTESIYRVTNWMEIKESKASNLCDVILYASMIPNIDSPTAKELATLAVKSSKDKSNHSSEKRRDGIQYLYDVKRLGIKTPMMKAYELEILKLLQVETLEEAIQKTSLK
jgi:hypothetical protein